MYIGTEHLLLGLLQHPQVARLLHLHRSRRNAGERPHLAEGQQDDRRSKASNVKHGLSMFLHTVIEQSVLIAHKFRHANVGTEHLLYAIISTGKNAAITLLESMQIDPDDLKTHVEEMFGQISQFRSQNKNLELRSNRSSRDCRAHSSACSRTRLIPRHSRRRKPTARARHRCSTTSPTT